MSFLSHFLNGISFSCHSVDFFLFFFNHPAIGKKKGDVSLCLSIRHYVLHSGEFTNFPMPRFFSFACILFIFHLRLKPTRQRKKSNARSERALSPPLLLPFFSKNLPSYGIQKIIIGVLIGTSSPVLFPSDSTPLIFFCLHQ